MTTTDIGNIHLALAAIMRDMIAIEKSKENTAQHFKFRGIDDVYNELHPIFAAHGVICLPFVEKAEHKDAGLTKAGNIQTRAIVTMGYRFTATDGSSTTASMIGEGMDSGDKATAKALSVAHKYLLLQTFLIPTADLVDADFYEPTVNAREELALKAKDRKVIEGMIKQRLADADEATGERKKELLGLAAELRCKLAEIDGDAELDKDPAPTVGGQPAKTVETTVLPPETTAPKATRARKPAPITDDLDMTTATQGMDTPWREFVCLRGPSPGMMNNHTLESIFVTGKMAPNSPLKLDRLMAWFTGNAYHTSTDPHDKVLWAKAQEADTELRAGFATGSPATPASTQTAPATEKPAQQPAIPTRWQDFVIQSKSPDWNGKKIGDLSPEQVKELKTGYIDQIDMSRATLIQKSLVAKVALAMAELFPKDLPQTANEAAFDHVKILQGLIAGNKWDAGFFITVCKLNTWIPESVRKIEDIDAEAFEGLETGWATVEEEMSKTTKPAQQP